MLIPDHAEITFVPLEGAMGPTHGREALAQPVLPYAPIQGVAMQAAF
jgi:hypothetical protein